jgi:hypothetical protein
VVSSLGLTLSTSAPLLSSQPLGLAPALVKTCSNTCKRAHLCRSRHPLSLNHRPSHYPRSLHPHHLCSLNHQPRWATIPCVPSVDACPRSRPSRAHCGCARRAARKTLAPANAQVTRSRRSQHQLILSTDHALFLQFRTTHRHPSQPLTFLRVVSCLLKARRRRRRHMATRSTARSGESTFVSDNRCTPRCLLRSMLASQRQI